MDSAALALLLVLLTVVSCTPTKSEGPDIEVRPLFVTPETSSCIMASPLMYEPYDGSRLLITITLDGLVQVLDSLSGERRWTSRIDAPDGQTPIVLSTGALVGERLVVAWQNTRTQEGLPDQGGWPRLSHHVGVLNLETRSWDTEFPILEVTGREPAYDGGDVAFESAQQLQRAALKHVLTPDSDLGLLYVAVGNGPSIQPFHGWLFEIDLDAWRAEGRSAAFSAVFVTTAENECVADSSRLDTMVCGGGIWTPAGPIIVGEGDDYEIFVPTGNGRIDPSRRAFAHSLLRLRRGLSFDAGCDVSLCVPFDDLNPDHDCLESCSNVFSARLPEGQELVPDHSQCHGLNFIECYGLLDADFGSSAPAVIQIPKGPRVLVHPAKDGALYLVDADHMGTLYDRLPLLDICGTDADPCQATWAGQFVTEPLTTTVDGDWVVIASGFMFDSSHPAGLVATRVQIKSGRPTLEKLWQTPDPSTREAVNRFRRHTGRPVLYTSDVGDEYVFVVEPRSGGGTLWAVRATDGRLVTQVPLAGDGVRYSKPYLEANRMYVGTCEIEGLGQGRIEAFEILD
jgi:hypothetical protein